LYGGARQCDWADYLRMDDEAPDEIPEEVSARAQQLWRALGYSSAASFAKAVGIPYSTWKMAESSGNISKPIAWTLQRRIPGFRAEWLWLGDRSMMAGYLLAKLDAVPVPRKVTTRSA